MNDWIRQILRGRGRVMFFWTRVLYVYGLGYIGLGRARQGLDLGYDGPGKKQTRRDKNTPLKLG